MSAKISDGASAGAVAAGWASWFITHLAQINGVLQFLLLLTSIGATLAAWRYHKRRTPKAP